MIFVGDISILFLYGFYANVHITGGTTLQHHFSSWTPPHWPCLLQHLPELQFQAAVACAHGAHGHEDRQGEILHGVPHETRGGRLN